MHFMRIAVYLCVYYIKCGTAAGNKDPGATDPGVTDPDATNPGATDPGVSDGQLLIANGQQAAIENYPWHAGIYRQIPGINNYTQDCGGSLISTKYVVSAAHCFWDFKILEIKRKEIYKIVLGKFHRDWQILDPGEVRFDVDEIVVQRQFRGHRGNYQYDIAVVKLKTDAVVSSCIKPVDVDWSNEFENDQLVTGKTGTLLGWGLTQHQTSSCDLQSVDLPYISGEDCADSLGPNLQRLVTGDKFCAGFIDKNISACPGDSGGGLVFYHRATDKHYLRGVLSLNFRPFHVSDGCYRRHVNGFTSLSDPLTLQWLRRSTNLIIVTHVTAVPITTVPVTDVPLTAVPVTGYQLSSKAGKYYRFYRNQLTWSEAGKFCQRQGRNIRLAVPTTSAQYKALEDLNHDKNQDGRMWLGLSDTRKEGEFETTTGTPITELSYVNWNEFEPNNGGWLLWHEEDCVQFGGPGNQGKLNDVMCSIEMPFICEYSR